MNKILMVDLKRQYLRLKEETDEAIRKVLDSGIFVKGMEVTAFEKQLSHYLQINHVIACGNGTDALQLALMALDLNPGDEVVTTPFTFVSNLEVISLLRLKPVFADIEEINFNISPTAIQKAISNKTKAIMPVHLFGQAANIEEVQNICQPKSIPIIEDTCQSLGTDFISSKNRKQKTGTIGKIGCTSFFPTKNLSAYGDGGAIFTNDLSLAERIRSLANHGREKPYEYSLIGVNSRLDTMQAAILSVRLKQLDDFIKRRQKAAAIYLKLLSDCSGIVLPQTMSYSTHTYNQLTIRVKDDKRELLQQYLHDNEIPTMIYYPLPLHLQKAYQFLGYKKGDFPVAEKMTSEVLSLPMHTELDEEQIHFICKKIKTFFS